VELKLQVFVYLLMMNPFVVGPVEFLQLPGRLLEPVEVKNLLA
jgi:hypothetical protein